MLTTLSFDDPSVLFHVCDSYCSLHYTFCTILSPDPSIFASEIPITVFTGGKIVLRMLFCSDSNEYDSEYEYFVIRVA